MLRFLLVFYGIFLPMVGVCGVQTASAADLDCAKPEHPVGQVICHDHQLLRLAEEMKQLLFKQQDFVARGDRYWQGKQLIFQNEVDAKCAAAKKVAACVRESYQFHIDMLKARPFNRPRAFEGKSFVRIADLGSGDARLVPDYDVGLRFKKPAVCESDEDICVTSGELAIYHKGYKNARQVIDFTGILFSIDPVSVGGSCGLRSMDSVSVDGWGCTIRYGGEELTQEFFAKMLQIGDYNFDGLVDFVFRPATSFGYVFVYSEQDRSFSYAPSLSTLFDYRSVEIDQAKQELKTYQHEHSNYYAREERYYKIENNMPVELRGFRRYREGNGLAEEEFVAQGATLQIVNWRHIPYPGDEKQISILDCDKPELPFEQVICVNEDLFEIHGQFAEVFRKVQNFVIQGDTSLVDAYHHWRATMYWNYEYGGNAFSPDMIKEAYREHIARLNHFPFAMPVDERLPFLLFDMAGFRPRYEIGFVLDATKGCNPDNICEMTGQLVVHKMRHKARHQTIGLPWLRLSLVPTLGDRNCPISLFDFDILPDNWGCRVQWENKELTEDSFKSLFQIGDYNFDGFPDFALRRFMPSADSTAYEAAWVFLYDDQDALFHPAPALSQLFTDSHVEVNAQRQELKISRNMQGFYEETDFHIKNNMPVAVRRFSRFIMEEAGEIVEKEEIRKDGEWQEVRGKSTRSGAMSAR